MNMMSALMFRNCARTLVLALLSLSIVWAASDLTLPAFCQKPGSPSAYHPQKQPESHIPWVWDASFDPVTRSVDVNTIMQSACYFNKTQWQEVWNMFPQYVKPLGGGNPANILVNASFDTDQYIDGLKAHPLKCRFYSKGKLVQEGSALPVNPRRPFLGPLMIRCPVPDAVSAFDSLQLEVKAPEGVRSANNRTALFPVCTLPAYEPQHRQYNLSVITATGRDNAEQLVEWIEYHLLVGVEHFFVYNTAVTRASEAKIAQIMDGYVRAGLVTLVTWQYSNCFKEGMSKGRPLRYRDHNGAVEAFLPPCPISAYGAHSSAYSRFKHTSKYLMYLDDDEFLSFTNLLPASQYNVKFVVDAIFAKHPKSPSVAFLPLEMNECARRDKELSYRLPTQHFPRLVTKHYGRIGRTHEFKQLMRTDHVAAFSVHYLTQLEADMNPAIQTSEDPFYIRIQHGTILHYKTPAYVSQDPFTSPDLLPIEPLEQVWDCHDSTDMLAVLEPLGKEATAEDQAVHTRSKKILSHVMPFHVHHKLVPRYSAAVERVKGKQN